MSGLKISLLKLSFRTLEHAELSTESSQYLFYTTKNVETFKCDLYTFTFMSGRKFVNLTGCTNFKSVVHAISLFKQYANINKIFELRIDTMSATISRNSAMRRPSASKFVEITHQKFPGIVYKSRVSKHGCTFFPKKIMFFGLKSLENIISVFDPLFPNE